MAIRYHSERKNCLHPDGFPESTIGTFCWVYQFRAWYAGLTYMENGRLYDIVALPEALDGWAVEFMLDYS